MFRDDRMYQGVNFYYAAGAMGWGNGRWWHRYLRLPDFPIITKTITHKPKTGRSWAIIHLGHSIWNWQGLPNIGFNDWMQYKEPLLHHSVILSIAGTDDEISLMVDYVNNHNTRNIQGIELNFSCPNVRNHKNKNIPISNFPLYLKLNCTQSPHEYDTSRIRKISVNSVPCILGALSGKLAQKKNWEFIRKNIDFPISGASWRTKDDLHRLLDMGCKNIDIGTVLLTNPKLLQRLDWKP